MPLAAIGLAVALSDPGWSQSTEEVRAIYTAAGLKMVGGAWHDGCDNPVTPKIDVLRLGGPVGDAIALEVSDAACFGSTGSHITILMREGSGLRPIFSDLAGGIQVIETRHGGVADIEIGVPGMQIPVFRWNGQQYEFWQSRKDPNWN